MPLRYSLSAFGLAPREYADLARRAEAEGFDTVWLGDHLISPVDYASRYPYAPPGGSGHAVDTPILDVWVSIGQLAAVTSRLRLATGVLVAPLRSPFVIARAAASAQVVSAGRMVLGLGAGWLREEFDAVGVSFDDRGRRLEETVAVLRKLWTGEVVGHTGAFFRFGDVRFVPRPERAIPIVLGGLSRAALLRAARCGDGWYGPVCTLAESVEARRTIEAERARLGRTGPFSFDVRVEEPLSRDRVLRYLDAGFDGLVVTGARLAPREAPPGERLDAASRAAEIFRAADG